MAKRKEKKLAPERKFFFRIVDLILARYRKPPPKKKKVSLEDIKKASQKDPK